MCGIAGLFLRDETERRCASSRAMRDAVTHRGPDDGGNFLERRARPRPPTAEHHRSRRRPSADARPTTAVSSSSSTARSTTTRRCAASSRLPAHVPHAVRHRGDSPAARAAWRRGRRAAERDLRVRDVGRRRAPAAAGARSRRHQAALSGRAPAAAWPSVRRSRRCSRQDSCRRSLDRSAASANTCCSARWPARSICSPASRACRPDTWWRSSTAGPGRPARYWDATRMPAPFAGTFEEATEALDAASERLRLAPADGRRAARDVLQRRHRFEPRDGSGGEACRSRAINTFSVGFDEADYDESGYARLAAQACRTNHHELRVSRGANSPSSCRGWCGTTTCR